MNPLFGALLTGGASLLGSVFSSETSAQNTQEQMANNLMMQQNSETFNAQQADLQRQFAAGQQLQAEQSNQSSAYQQEAFQEQMSNTAYQRASQDMQKAGLNPMMMFGSGGAASSPAGSAPTTGPVSGAAASVGTGSAATPMRTSALAGLGAAASSAMDAAVKSKQVDLLTSEVAKKNVETDIATQGDLPEARNRGIEAGYWKAFMERNPEVADILSVGPHIGRSVDETLKPGFDALGSVWGGLRGLAGKLFNLGSSAKAAAPSESAGNLATGNSATAVRRGMDIERSFKDRWGDLPIDPRDPGFQGEGR